MSLNIADNFSYLGAKPLDNRLICDRIYDMITLPYSTIYDGIIVYNRETESFYTYKSTNPEDMFLGKWEELTVTSESTGEHIYEYEPDSYYEKGSLLTLNTYIGRALETFISHSDYDIVTDSIVKTVEECWDIDVELGYIEPLASTTRLVQYQLDTFYTKGTMLYLGSDIAVALGDFTSQNTLTSSDYEENLHINFEDDIKIGNLMLVTPISDAPIRKYYQLNYYYKDTLVYCGDLLALVTKDFVSNADFIADESSGYTDEDAEADSFQQDIANGYLQLINKEVKHVLRQYMQNTLYDEDILIYGDGRIFKATKSFISDNTAPTLRESIKLDILAGNLEEYAENWKFKMYKSTWPLAQNIDDISIILDSQIVFENNETIFNMNVHEGLYDANGTIAIIESIDVNTNEITARTITSHRDEFMPPAPESYEFTILSSGTGYSVGEIVPTDLPAVNVEVEQVGSNGEILHVKPTNETMTNAEGMGHSISAKIIMYVGNGKIWYELPEDEKSSLVKEYEQGAFYTNETLVFLDDILAIATGDFTANNTAATTKESFLTDINNGYLLRMTKEEVDVPECLGSCKTESDLPTTAIKGNWMLVETTPTGEAGIALYKDDGMGNLSWEITAIPQGEFQFPEPSDDGELYFRSRESGNTEGQWVKFTSVDGNEVKVTLKTKNDLTDNTYVPDANELVWDTNRKILVIGDGSTTLGSLKAFYDQSALTATDIISALGFTPEDQANKGQANGYAPLDANAKVPAANLPDSLVDTYSKTEVDTKITTLTTNVTSLVNTEATTARANENAIKADLTAHTSNTAIHVTQNEKDNWDAKVDISDLTDYDNHLSDTVVHVTQDDKDRWDGMNKAYYVSNVADLPDGTGDDIPEIGNIGYVQISTIGDVAAIDQYIWDGSGWKQMDTEGVSLQLKWGNLQDKPSSTVLSIDNSVALAHTHANKSVLEKIGQSAAGNFTYDGVEIGVRVEFYETEKLLPATGQEDTLYVIYEDGRTRKYPSISVYKDGAYQILGRGAQENAPAVGDMNILQNEYYSVSANSTYQIHFSPNQYFAFLPIEILKEIEGLKNQTRVICDIDDPGNYDYPESLITIDTTNKCRVDAKEISMDFVVLSGDYAYYKCNVDLTNYKDIDSIE